MDEAILDHENDKYEILKEMKPDVICLGYDQVSFTEQIPEKLKEFGITAEIIRLKPYKKNKYKSSKMKE